MWLAGGDEVKFFLDLDFMHTHDAGLHMHDAAVAEVKAHQLAHRLASCGGAAEPLIR
jgi:hypothetical protein